MILTRRFFRKIRFVFVVPIFFVFLRSKENLDDFRWFRSLNRSEILFLDGPVKNFSSISSIFVLNLPKRVDRRTEMIGILRRLKFSAFFVPALSADSELIDFHDRWFFKRTEFACWASHLRLWRSIEQNFLSQRTNSSWFLIFEDDVDLESNFQEIIFDFPESIWHEADLIYFGHCANPPGVLFHRSLSFRYRIHQAIHPSCTHSYAVKSSIISRLIRSMSKPTEPIDNALIKSIKTNSFRAFSLHPPVVQQKQVSTTNPSDVNLADRTRLFYRIQFRIYQFLQWWNNVEPEEKLQSSTLETINRNDAIEWRKNNERGIWLLSHSNISEKSF